MDRRFVLLVGTAVLATAVAAAYGGSPLGGSAAPTASGEHALDGAARAAAAPCERVLRIGYRKLRVEHMRFFGPPCDD